MVNAFEALPDKFDLIEEKKEKIKYILEGLRDEFILYKIGKLKKAYFEGEEDYYLGLEVPNNPYKYGDADFFYFIPEEVFKEIPNLPYSLRIFKQKNGEFKFKTTTPETINILKNYYKIAFEEQKQKEILKLQEEIKELEKR